MESTLDKAAMEDVAVEVRGENGAYYQVCHVSNLRYRIFCFFKVDHTICIAC